MVTVNLAQAKAHLCVGCVWCVFGEEVVITRHGKPVAHIRAAAPAKMPLPLEKLAAFRAGKSPWRKDSATLVREMREDERY